MAGAAQQHRPTAKGKRHKASKVHTKQIVTRGTSRERGYTAEWDEFSKAHKQRRPLCEFCLGKGKTTAATVTDHDIPHRGDVELFWDNTFTSLCGPCHNGTKARLEARLDGSDLLDAIRRLKGHATR